MKSPVRLYLRVRLPDGSYSYLAVSYARNGRLRPHTATFKGTATHFPSSSYYLRYQLDGRRIWEPVGADPSIAVVSFQKKAHELQAAVLGLAPPRPPVSHQPSTPLSESAPSTKRLYRDLESTYIAETKEHKPVRTLAAYKRILKSFGEVIGKKYVEDITREDLLTWITALWNAGNTYFVVTATPAWRMSLCITSNGAPDSDRFAR